MSGGRFLINLQEVIKSDSIIKLYSLLKRNIEITSLSTPASSISTINEFARKMLPNDCDHLLLTQESLQVTIYISGYIFLQLSKCTQFPTCSRSLNKNLVLSGYVRYLNQGGLTLPCTTLHHYVESSFCLLEVSEGEIRSSSFP